MQLARLGSSAWAFAVGIPWDRTMHLRLKHTSGTRAGHSFGVVDRRESAGGGPLVGRWWVVSLKNQKGLYRCTRIESEQKEM